jgi:hypothetical protein
VVAKDNNYGTFVILFAKQIRLFQSLLITCTQSSSILDFISKNFPERVRFSAIISYVVIVLMTQQAPKKRTSDACRGAIFGFLNKEFSK